MARLVVFLGAGGVGKTTLAASYALALAGRGLNVGLLGIDPSRRLQGALGLALQDLEAPLPDAPTLRAAILQPHQALRRWVTEASGPELAARLERNPFFAALTDRLATATDVLAAARIAEWAERDPQLDVLIVDTAPGPAALDFLRHPRQLEQLLQGALIAWLRAASRTGGLRLLRFGAKRVLAAFARLAGAGMVSDLAALFAQVGPPLQRLVERLERAQAWMKRADTELILVTSPRDAGAAGARQLAELLSAVGIPPCAVVVNRTWPDALAAELRSIAVPAGAERLVSHLQGQLVDQQQVISAAAMLAPLQVMLPARPQLGLARAEMLRELGALLDEGLAAKNLAAAR